MDKRPMLRALVHLKKRKDMKTLKAFIAIACLALGTVACHSCSGAFGTKTIKASKNYVRKDIRVDRFSKLAVAGSMDVAYTQKPGRPTVEVYTSDNIAEVLDIRVEGSTLCIGFKKNVSVSYGKLEIKVSSERLSGIAVAGSGGVEVRGGLKADDLAVSVAGSGDVDVERISCTNLSASVAGSGDVKLPDVAARRTKVSVAGSGDVEIKGIADEVVYSVAGSGDISAAGFKARKVNASVTGSGDIKCHATDSLKVRIAGSGDVGYKGNPVLDLPKKGVHRL